MLDIAVETISIVIDLINLRGVAIDDVETFRLKASLRLRGLGPL